jgi:alkaline phosphatase D
MNRFHIQRLLSTKVKRRNLLIGAGAMTGLAIASQWSQRALAQPKFSADPFSLGVASGDPLPDSVVLWTRLAPDPLKGGGMPPVNVPVQWQIALDQKMRNVVRRGIVVATPELAHSVHVDVRGLEPARWYWYQFKVGNQVSRIGRTRTAPALGSRISQFRFAFANCQDWQNGYYTAYHHLAEEELDLVVHLGDYIYEYGPQPGGHANIIALKFSPLPTTATATPFTKLTRTCKRLMRRFPGYSLGTTTKLKTITPA